MLNTHDQATFLSIRELKRVVQESKKPLVFWIGAGAGKWLGYPIWKELARGLRSEFFRFVRGFDDVEARTLIATNSFPTFFQRCLDLDRPRYYHPSLFRWSLAKSDYPSLLPALRLQTQVFGPQFCAPPAKLPERFLAKERRSMRLLRVTAVCRCWFIR